MKTLNHDEINFLKYSGLQLNHDDFARLGIPYQGSVSIEDKIKEITIYPDSTLIASGLTIAEAMPILDRYAKGEVITNVLIIDLRKNAHQTKAHPAIE